MQEEVFGRGGGQSDSVVAVTAAALVSRYCVVRILFLFKILWHLKNISNQTLL